VLVRVFSMFRQFVGYKPEFCFFMTIMLKSKTNLPVYRVVVGVFTLKSAGH